MNRSIIAIVAALIALAGCAHTVQTAEGQKVCYGTGQSCAKLTQKWEQDEFTRNRLAKEQEQAAKEAEAQIKDDELQERRLKFAREHPAEAARNQRLMQLQEREWLSRLNIFGCPGNMLPSRTGGCLAPVMPYQFPW
jgi:hypothetical protein